MKTHQTYWQVLWRYRGFVKASIVREFQARYLNSVFGAVWAVLQPLTMILVYTLVFSGIMQARLPGANSAYAYSIYLCAGLLAWNFFVEVVTRLQQVFIEQSALIKKVNIPHLALPLIVVGSAAVNFSIAYGLFLTFLAMTGNWPGWPMLAVLPLVALQTAFAVALGMMLSIINVFFRDVGHLVGIVLQLWFWLTPVVYSLQIVPAQYHGWLSWNPLLTLITAHHQAVSSHQWPEWSSLQALLLVTVIMAGLSVWLYRRHITDVLDEI